jgi:polyhydroxyalkanoate synthesis regulator phasin
MAMGLQERAEMADLKSRVEALERLVAELQAKQAKTLSMRKPNATPPAE